ncbi:MAG: KEOPS complex kinase/ATPase Bud32 [Candidatus Aenigmatarchaeota archaeon]
MKLIAQGAEAKVYLTDDGKILKERVKKSYRIGELDTYLRKTRTKKESKILADAKRLGLCAPIVYNDEGFCLEMEFIGGEKLKDALSEKNSSALCKKLGGEVAKMHSGDIIHGDLTTSNVLVREGEICFIDFGLSVETKSPEQKAADLLTLYQNFRSVHPDLECWAAFLKGYGKDADVLRVFEKMLKRRRYL